MESALKEVYMGHNRSGKIKHLLISTTKELFSKGMGTSKYKMFEESYNRDRTRQSQVIHSYSTENRYERVVANFSDFLKEEYGLKYERDFRKLTTQELYNYVDKYFEREKEKGKSESTLKIHISGLCKVLGAIDPEIKKYFDADSRARWRDGEARGFNDRYNDPEKIVENLSKISETSHAIAQIQRFSGCRVGDVKKVQIDEENKRITIENSKGGRSRSVYFDYFPQEFEELKRYKEKLDKALEERPFSEIRKEYYHDLRKACKESGEPYHGSHCFRHEWAQETYKVISQLPQEEQEAFYRRILEERGKSEKDIEKAMENAREKDCVAEYIISEELGHSRLDISLHYLKIRRL